MALYNKPYLDVGQQLALMKSRGIVVADEPRALACLKRIGYYRLSGYAYPFRRSQRVPKLGGGFTTTILDNFQPNTNFSTIVELYVFDKKLRMLILDAVERVEVGLRVAIGDLLGIRNPIAHLTISELHGNFSKKINPYTSRTKHSDWIVRYREAVRRSNEEFVVHFNTKYAGSELPIWIAIEVWDFGLMSWFLAGMKHADIQTLAQSFGVPRQELLTSWVRAINNVRNACAHHSRLWNAPVIDYPKPPRANEVPLLNHITTDINAQTRLYYVAALLRFLLIKINPSTTWPQRLKEHLATFPSVTPISIHQMGFPQNWGQQLLWQ